jgi:formylglycine-generating enzyme required for sulfatase activity
VKLFLVLACVCAAGAAQTRASRPNEIRVQQKLALVIGNGAYPSNALKNPVNDAAAMARTLRALGFDDVTERRDLNRRQMRQEIDKFVAKINKGDMAWVYYAGHGVQANERNYIIPVDFMGEESDLDYDAYPADQLRDKLERSGARLRILILDACRNNPFRRSKRDGTRGLVHMDSSVEGTYIAFATADNSVAEDNPGEANGLFTKYLLAALTTPGMDLKQAFERTKEAVYAASDHHQRPYTYDGVVGQYFFNAPVTIVNNPPPSSDLSAQQELAFWNAVDRNDAESLELYLQRFPNGSFVSLAKRSLERLRAPAVEASRVGLAIAAPVNGPPAGTVKTNPKDGQRYVWIPPGKFMMGCSPGDGECFDDEKPAHEVEITKGFWLGQTAVTVAAWKRSGKTMPPEPKLLDRALNANWADGQQPIVDITWDEANEYCRQAGGRLPTEAEWEYAARAGSTGSRYGSLDAIAWYADNSGKSHIDSADIFKNDEKNYASRLNENGNGLHGVAQKEPNAWTLYDMLGNVWQWTANWYNEKYYQQNEAKDPQGPPGGQGRTQRGGSWGGNPRYLRVSDRGWDVPAGRYGVNGVRCAWE